MPKSVVLTCLAPEVKDLFTREMAAIDDGEVQQLFAELVDTIADCPGGQALGIQVQESEATERRRKRRRSAFNNFVSECATGGAKTLPECASIWRTMSDAEKERYRTR